MNQMNDTLNQSFRDQEDGQYQLNDLINDFSESEGVEQTQNINSNKKPAFDKIFNETNEQNDEGYQFNELLDDFGEKSEVGQRKSGEDKKVNKSSEVTSADSQNSTNPTSIRRRYQRNRNQDNNQSS
jgi:hypothetical protein